MNSKAKELRARATASDREAERSFERCDTDGFVSQWAHGLSADRDRLEAEIVENGGMAEIACVVDADDRIVPVRWIKTRFGGCNARFADFDSANSRSGQIVEWLSDAKMERLGYRAALCLRPARAALVGTNSTNVRPVAVAADGVRVDPEAQVVVVFGRDDEGNLTERRIER